jgi:choline-sulfatase
MPAVPAVPPSNLLILMADQHNRQMMGCAGHPDIKTPNLDALAARGTRFANAYTNSPICVPSRAAMATGRYPHQIGVWDNAAPYTGTPASWGHRLTAAGRPVTTIGKLHYRGLDDDTGFPDQRIPLHCHEGVGDYQGLLRADMPPRFQHRKYLLEAGPGDSEYLRYDRAITTQAVGWLQDEAGTQTSPWVLMVSWVCPHPPFIAPPEYLALYDPDTITLPVGWQEADWVQHPAMELRRKIMFHQEPLDEATLRQAICTYYALVSFMDAQIGAVLAALDAAGLTDSTRVLYTNDHGDMVGEHGLWYKSVMYEESAGVSMIDLANEPERRSRIAFSEYHSSMSASASFMLRDDRYKLISYVGMPTQLFDLAADPDECHNLADDPAHARILADLEAKLRAICDPEAVDAEAQASQRRRVAAVGGAEAIISGGVKFTHSPPPAQFVS